MDINRANMTEFFEELKAEFTGAFTTESRASLLPKMAFVIDSQGASMTHAWLKQLPQIREWLGDRQVKNVESKSMTVLNRLFEATLAMKRTDIEDDMHGLYKPIVGSMGVDGANFPVELCFEALLKGTATTWVDDLAFFSSARVYGENTIDNYGTDALSVTNFNSAIATIGSYLGGQNKPLGVKPFALLYGPALRVTAFEVLRDDFAARTADATGNPQGLNPNKNLIEPIESDMLIDGVTIDGTSYDAANYWFILCQKSGIRGIAYQDRLSAELQTQKWNPDSEFTFDTDEFEIGTRLRGEAFLAIPHLVYGSFAT